MKLPFSSIRKDVVIIGAGAAGLLCAIEAGKRGRSVLVIDHSKRIGNKIRISGGGRCNFTNVNISHANYLSGNPHFCKSAIARFTPYDFIGMLEKYNIGYYEKDDGRLFCKKSSGEVIDMLHKECAKSGVAMLLGCGISDIERRDSFCVYTDKGLFEAESLVMATGGLSYPELGATDAGYRAARQFGIEVTPVKPALVPLRFGAEDNNNLCGLSGISIKVRVSCNKTHFQGDMLFTHHGLSGPAILQISSYWNEGDEINIDLLPDMDAYELFATKRQSRIEMRNLLSQFFPKRFAHTWCETNMQPKPVCQYNDKEIKEGAYKLHNWVVMPAGTEGYKKAEVTLGGIDTDELSSKTMEAKKVKGLYFIGEVVDVTGHLGGYNLHWAWASGFAAGQHV